MIHTGSVEVSRGRRALVGKRCVASFETAEQLRELLWLEAARCGVQGAKQVVFISDGEPWIPKVQQVHFPGALVALDQWHLEPALREVLRHTPRSIGPLMRMAMAGQSERVARRLRALVERAWSPEDAEARRDLLPYVEANAEGIRNLPRSPVVGSSAVEKGVDVLVCRRLKTRGMSWERPGAAALQRLQVFKHNGDWEEYWRRRDGETVKRAA